MRSTNMAGRQNSVLHQNTNILQSNFNTIIKNAINYRSLPFCVRMGVPDERVPATDNGLAIVDILELHKLRQTLC
jgi:hypothetical protein